MSEQEQLTPPSIPEFVTKIRQFIKEDEPINALGIINEAYSKGELEDPYAVQQVREATKTPGIFPAVLTTAYDLLQRADQAGDKENMPKHLRTALILGLDSDETPTVKQIIGQLVDTYGVQTYTPPEIQTEATGAPIGPNIENGKLTPEQAYQQIVDVIRKPDNNGGVPQELYTQLDDSLKLEGEESNTHWQDMASANGQLRNSKSLNYIHLKYKIEGEDQEQQRLAKKLYATFPEEIQNIFKSEDANLDFNRKVMDRAGITDQDRDQLSALTDIFAQQNGLVEKLKNGEEVTLDEFKEVFIEKNRRAAKYCKFEREIFIEKEVAFWQRLAAHAGLTIEHGQLKELPKETVSQETEIDYEKEVEAIEAQVTGRAIGGKFPPTVEIKGQVFHHDNRGEWNHYGDEMGGHKFGTGADLPSKKVNAALKINVRHLGDLLNSHFLMASKIPNSDEAILTYSIPQDWADASGRPARRCTVNFKMPAAATIKLLELIRKNPDVAEMFLQKAAEGFEATPETVGKLGIPRIQSDEIVFVDLNKFEPNLLKDDDDAQSYNDIVDNMVANKNGVISRYKYSRPYGILTPDGKVSQNTKF